MDQGWVTLKSNKFVSVNVSKMMGEKHPRDHRTGRVKYDEVSAMFTLVRAREQAWSYKFSAGSGENPHPAECAELEALYCDHINDIILGEP